MQPVIYLRHLNWECKCLLADYGYIGILLIVAALFAVALPLLSLLLSFVRVTPRKPDEVKSSTYECGMDTTGKSWVQFNFRYYLYALVFVVFDVQTVFLYPWAVAMDKLALFGIVEMLVFVLIIVVGFVYAWRKGALEWK